MKDSRDMKGIGPWIQNVPAFFFSRNALSSSSMSFAAFFGALRGLAFPPVIDFYQRRS